MFEIVTLAVGITSMVVAWAGVWLSTTNYHRTNEALAKIQEAATVTTTLVSQSHAQLLTAVTETFTRSLGSAEPRPIDPKPTESPDSSNNKETMELMNTFARTNPELFATLIERFMPNPEQPQ